MKFLVVENNKQEQDTLAAILQKTIPSAEIISMSQAEDVLNLSSQIFDAAFVNPELEAGKMTGLELSERLKQISKDTHIIFVTPSEKFYRDAFRIHADGYIEKAASEITDEDIKREIIYLAKNYAAPLKVNSAKKIYIRMFGGFDIYVDGEILTFDRNKAKELLALLVDRRGGSLNAREACGFLFEGEPYDILHNGYYHVIVSSMVQTLGKFGIKNILVKNRKRIAINPKAFECDAYDYLRGDTDAVRQYNGDYLNCYKWSGYATKLLNNIRSEGMCRMKRKKQERLDPQSN